MKKPKKTETYVLVLGPTGETIAFYTMTMEDLNERRRLGSESHRALKAGQTVITTPHKEMVENIRRPFRFKES